MSFYEAPVSYVIRHLHTGKEKIAHIDQIARMRLGEASKSEEQPDQVAVDAVDVSWKIVEGG